MWNLTPTLDASIALILGIFLASSGPSSAQPLTPGPGQENPFEARKKCFEEFKQADFYQGLQRKLVFDENSPEAFEAYANNNKPTKKDKLFIAKLSANVDTCEAFTREWIVKNYPPPISALNEHFLFERKLLLTDLYSGNITFAEANKRARTLEIDTKSKVTEEVQKLRACQ